MPAMPKPRRLTFFCELPSEGLCELFADGSVTNDIAALGARVAFGTVDLDIKRAETIRQIRAAGVPVVAWILLPESDGYWCTSGNVDAVRARYAAVRDWSEEHGVIWDAVGLDVEIDIREVQIGIDDRRRIPGIVARRLLDRRSFERARLAYAALTGEIRAAGLPVEHYMLPFVLDDRRCGSTVLQRLSGVLDIPADVDVPMLYTARVCCGPTAANHRPSPWEAPEAV
jgi:hypothetical protein